MKFQVDNSNTFRDMLRTKMSDGRTDGRTETISISPAAFLVGDINQVWFTKICQKTMMGDHFIGSFFVTLVID
jgi:hypothetical protein